jgi:hypothetical protein
MAMGGCSIAPAPLKDTPHIVATPENGQLTISSEPSKPIGDVLPIYVSIANGTDSPRAIVPNQIFALDDAGSRIAPLPPAEAARQAGGAGELRAGLLSAGASGLVEGAIGAGIGAIAGSFIHSGVRPEQPWAEPLAAVRALLMERPAGPAKADSQANIQLTRACICQPRTFVTTSPSAGTSSFRRAITKVSRCCWWTTRPAIRKLLNDR